MNSEYNHIPVLLQEALDFLRLKSGDVVVDATLGGGGYTKAISKIVGIKGRVLAIDLDSEAIAHFQKPKNVSVVQGNFREIDKFVEESGFTEVNGIVADIGLSTYELEGSNRGISFQKNEPLDMRFDRNSKEPDASFILNNSSEKELSHIFSAYGEEKHASRIAREIVRERQKSHIRYTSELARIIELALPKPVKHKANQSARRIFQSLRIAVNHELSNLEEFLPKAFEILSPGGRLVVVSFHSLEDRIIKQFFNKISKGCVCPPEFPICMCGKEPQGKVLTRKPLVPTTGELNFNPRSKPAKLRAVEKISSNSPKQK